MPGFFTYNTGGLIGTHVANKQGVSDLNNFGQIQPVLTFVANATISVTGNNVNIAIPSAAAAGDIAVLVASPDASAYPSTGITVSTAGWTSIVTANLVVNATANAAMTSFYKTLIAGEPGSNVNIRIATTASIGHRANMLVFRPNIAIKTVSVDQIVSNSALRSGSTLASRTIAINAGSTNIAAFTSSLAITHVRIASNYFIVNSNYPTWFLPNDIDKTLSNGGLLISGLTAYDPGRIRQSTTAFTFGTSSSAPLFSLIHGFVLRITG